MAALNLRCVAPAGDHCGEALMWSAAEGAIYWTDVNRFLVHRMVLATSAVETWLFDEPCVALSPTSRAGTLLLALGSRLILWQPSGDVRSEHGIRLASAPAARLNEGRSGPGGEFWVGSMGNNVGRDGESIGFDGAPGELFRIIDGAPPQRFKAGLKIANTLCVSPDQRQLYFGDSMQNIIWRYDYDPMMRSIGGEMPFFAGFDRGVPDGSAIDADGYLWNARFGGACLVRIAPDGSVDRIVELPISNPTTCAFGGGDLRTLFFTTASIHLTRPERLAGSVFALDAPAPGLLPFPYKLA